MTDFGASFVDVDIPLKCRCGSVRGVAKQIVPSQGNRLVCMCDDCQAFAHHLGAAERVLDPHGGTDIFQTTPSRVSISEGIEHLACLRLSPKGLMRWYAKCCNTPIANTMASPRVPFAGVVHTFMDHTGTSRDEALGPILARIQGRFAVGAVPEGAHRRAPMGIIFRTIRLLGGGFIRGTHRPSPFFDSSGNPVIDATVLSASEREKLRTLCGGFVKEL